MILPMGKSPQVLYYMQRSARRYFVVACPRRRKRKRFGRPICVPVRVCGVKLSLQNAVRIRNAMERGQQDSSDLNFSGPFSVKKV